MQDIKRRNKLPTKNRPTSALENSSDNLIKKIVIFVVILFFVGMVVFSFFWEEKDSRQIIIKIPESEKNNEKSISKNVTENNAIDKNVTEEDIFKEQIVTEENQNINYLIFSEEAKKIIENKANQSIDALKNKDFKTLAELIHSEHKLTFSPYANFSEKNQSFSQDKIKNISSDSKKYIWGEYNGLSTGKIEMTFADYYELFIYDQDFSNAEKISFNQDISIGNIKSNAQDFFENSITVEYHFSGFEPEFAGMDWRSLRLVFIEIDGEWYLKGISHDEWTI